MNGCDADFNVGPPVTEPGRLDEDVVELPLLLPGWQVQALEAAAHGRGLTTGQMLRTVLRDFFTGLGGCHGISSGFRSPG
jgi:hypothetical protein